MVHLEEVAELPADGTQYILAQPTAESEVGFYQATIGTIAARKAYIVSTSGIKAFFINFDDATGLKDLNDLKDSKDSKDSKDIIFNIAGQRLNKMQKGVNIMSSRKMVVK